MSEIRRCTICGEPMPPGEEMFNFHGYSGPCPKVPEAQPVAWALMRDGALTPNMPPTFTLPTDAAEVERVWRAKFVPLYALAAPVAPCERCADRERSGYRIASEPCSEAQAQEVGKLFAERDGLRDEVARLRQQHVGNTNTPDAAARDAARVTITEAMVEAAARNMYERTGPNQRVPWERKTHHGRAFWLGEARAALDAALRASEGEG